MVTIFNHDIIEKHSIYRTAGSTLQKISEKDYPGKDYFDERIKALDLDSFARQQHKEPAHSVDAVIGISNYDAERDTENSPRLLLVELKLKVKSDSNIIYTEYDAKIEQSKAMLSGDMQVATETYFLYLPNRVEMARSNRARFIQEGKNKVRNWKFSTPENFKKEILFKEDCVYKTTPENIYQNRWENDLKNIVELVKHHDDSCLEIIDKWILLYYEAYKNTERTYIREGIKSMVKAMKDSNKLEMYITLYEEDNPNIWQE